MSLVITRQQLDALYFAAQSGNLERVQSVIRQVDEANAVTRHALYVRWQTYAGTPELYVNQRTDYPPFTKRQLVMDRAISRDDVLKYVTEFSPSPINIQVTPDTRGEIGWTELDVYVF